MKKTILKMNRLSVAYVILSAALLLTACKKDEDTNENKHHASNHSSYVVDKWMTLQLRLMRNATGIPNHAFSRHFTYSGIAAFESLKPGLTGTSKHWSNKWNGLTGLPAGGHSKDYYYPANVNSALAAINRLMFSNAKEADKAVIDSLETALKQEFLLLKTQAEIEVSAQFGKEVATAVFNWAETDNYKNASSPYTAPTGAGLWKPTAPAFALPITPYWGNNRPVVTGSIANTQLAAPVAYSTEPRSAFYNMVKQVYDVSQTLTDDQKSMAIFWRDVPGTTSPGHWLSILQQTMVIKQPRLDEAALAYALTGAAINDALISCFKSKYQYNLVRPITYIREVIGYSNWNTYIGTPAHPEYSSAHASLSAAAADVLTRLFGNSGSFTDHTYDYLGLAARTYPSFVAIGEEAGYSRVYGGIHYVQSVIVGFEQGRKVSANIFSGN